MEEAGSQACTLSIAFNLPLFPHFTLLGLGCSTWNYLSATILYMSCCIITLPPETPVKQCISACWNHVWCQNMIIQFADLLHCISELHTLGSSGPATSPAPATAACKHLCRGREYLWPPMFPSFWSGNYHFLTVTAIIMNHKNCKNRIMITFPGTQELSMWRH